MISSVGLKSLGRMLGTLPNIPKQQRCLGTGPRGARGHGWFVKYRSGKGGRHLQGEYHDRPSELECTNWNKAILELGSQAVYLDIVVKPKTAVNPDSSEDSSASVEDLSSYRLEMDLAHHVMPETVENFVQLCQMDSSADGLKGSILYRFERNVGLCGGDVLTNNGRCGKSPMGKPMTLTIQNDPLVMWHVPGTVTMSVHTVGDIDSRFVLCTAAAPHMDGIHRAFGQLRPESLKHVQEWQRSLLTRKGVPTSFDLLVADCGVLDESNNHEDEAA